MPDCLFPTCSRNADGNGYCIFHKIYSNSAEVKVPKEIAKKSDNQKEIDKELKKLYPIYLSRPENKACKIKMEGCTKKATVVHHTRGRIGDQVFEQKDWLPSCPSCNIVLETRHAESVEKGFKKPRHQKQ